MHVWVDATSSFAPYLIGVCLGLFLGGLIIPFVSLGVAGPLKKMNIIENDPEELIAKTTSSAGQVVGSITGFVFVWFR